MKKRAILLCSIVIVIIIGVICFYKYINNHNSYLVLHSAKIDTLWNKYDTYLDKLTNNIEEINKKNYEDNEVNLIIHNIIKTYYEYSKDNSKYSHSFYELRSMNKISKSDMYYLYFESQKYSILEHQEILSVKIGYEYEILNNYLDSILQCRNFYEENAKELDFEQIINIKIMELQIVNSMTEWLINTSL